MKKLLSLILAITMIAAFIPTAFAADGDATTVTYAFNNASWFERVYILEQNRKLNNDVFKTEALTDTEWAYLGSVTSTNVSYNNNDSGYNMVVGNYGDDKTSTRAVTSGEGEWLAFKIEIPEKGKYSPSVKAVVNKSCINDLDIYILPVDTKVTVGEYSGKLVEVFNDDRVYGSYDETTEATTCTRTGAKKFCDFSFDSIDTEDYKAIDGASTYRQGGNSTTPEDLTTGTKKDLELDAGIYVVLLCANDEGWLTISSLTLTAEAESESEETTPIELKNPIAFGAGADILVNDEAYTTGNIISFDPGKSVTVKVTDKENFAGWVRGTKDSGVWVSSDPEYKFNIMSPTYLTPVYTTLEETVTHAVEFWDENGAYVETIPAPEGKAVLPTSGYGLVGGSFNGWWLNATTQLLAGADVAEGITRAVAKYNYGSFGTPVSNSNESATYWKRGDDIVAYGSSYDYYTWSGDETITASTEDVVKNPIIVLDSTSVDGAYMIEYDKGNADAIVEAGIIFGSDTDIVIGSTDGSKAASQRNGDDTGHGQFCAKPNSNGAHAYARGYLIYEENETLYVIYTAAVATTASAE